MNKVKFFKKHAGIIDHFYGACPGNWPIKASKKQAEEVCRLLKGLKYDNQGGVLFKADDSSPDPELMVMYWKEQYEAARQTLDEGYKLARQLAETL